MRPRSARLGAGCLLGAALVLGGCAGGPPAPDWQVDAHGALNRFTAAYLEGNERVAGLEFARAREALSRTGRTDLVARAELTRCAAEVASLAFDDCPGYAPLAVDAGKDEKSYVDFLAGRPVDAARLPGQYRAVAGAGDPVAALAAIASPLSRLIAAGALLRAARLPPAGVDLAVATASAQGWRRPLLAWLGVQRKLAADAGDADAVARLSRRIELVGGRR